MATFLESVDWDKAENTWDKTFRIWSGNLVTIVVDVAVAPGGGTSAAHRAKDEPEYLEKLITIRVICMGKEFSMTKTKREYIDVKAKSMSDRITEILKPNIKIKIGKD